MPAPALPPSLAAFLRTQSHALLLHDTDQGAVLVLKAPSTDIDDLRGHVEVLVRYELYQLIQGPVIRLFFAAGFPNPLVMETFVNPADPEQMRDLEDALKRDHLRMVCYDEHLRYVLGKHLSQPTTDDTRAIPGRARRLLAATDPSLLDFDRAKAIVQQDVPLIP